MNNLSLPAEFVNRYVNVYSQCKQFINRTLSIFSTFVMLTIVINADAALVENEECSFRQPDGSMVPVIVNGDEYYQTVETPDGYTLIREQPSQWICYAKVSEDGSELISTGIHYMPADKLTKSAFSPVSEKRCRLDGKFVLSKRVQVYKSLHGTLPGQELTPAQEPKLAKTLSVKIDTIYGVTILIDFPDQKSSMSRDSILLFLNQKGYTANGNNGSVSDFYYDISNGKLVYLQKVTNFITAKNNKSYYDRTDGSGYAGSDELAKEILTNLKSSAAFDFSKATLNGTAVRAVNILYAGSASAGWAQGLWPHSSYTNFLINGVYVRNYMMASIGTKMTIGTFCHENGHMLCSWPDLYAYDDHSNGAGRFDLMAVSGSTNPPPPNAYLRSLKGWMQVTDISANAQGKLFKLPVNVNIAYEYSGKNNGSTQETFFIEARRRKGRSATLPDDGLLIWHIDKSGDNTKSGVNDQQMPEQADGKNDLENKINTGDVNDLFAGPTYANFNDNTTPSAKWHNGTASKLQIANVSAIADTMSFSFGTLITDVKSVQEFSSIEKISFNHVNNTIQYMIPSNAPDNLYHVTLQIYGPDGRCVNSVVNNDAKRGQLLSSVINNGGQRLSSGIYICRIDVNGVKQVVPVNVY